MEELGKIIAGFKYATQAAVHTLLVLSEIGQIGDIRDLLQSSDIGYQNVQTFFWYKPDMNVVGPFFKAHPCRRGLLDWPKGSHQWVRHPVQPQQEPCGAPQHDQGPKQAGVV
jgi:hypothetical protein